MRSVTRRQFIKTTSAAAIVTAGSKFLPSIFIPEARADIIPGEIQRHDDVLTWWSYVPADLEPGQKANTLVQAVGASFDYDDNIEGVKGLMNDARIWTDRLKMPQIGIAFPRGEPFDEYSVAFPRASFSGTLDPLYTNPHEKVNDILDTFMEQLDKMGFDVNQRVYIAGFSNGGGFAQKYSIIMPERVSAIAAGGLGGSFVMPLSVYNNPGSPNDGFVLDWEVGINDLESLVGKTFNDAAYREIYQYIFQGSEDYKQDHTMLGAIPSGMYTDEQVNFLKSEFGNIDPVIEGNIINFLAGLGYDRIKYEVWDGYDHLMTDDMWQTSYDFFENHMEVPESKTPPLTQGSSDSGGGGGCYAATHLMNNGRISTAELASLYDLRNKIQSGMSPIHRLGQKGIDIYYKFSPGFVERLEKSPMENKIDTILQLPVRMAAKAGEYLARHKNTI